MLRGCLFALFFWLALAAGYGYWFDHVFDPPGSIVGAALVGLVIAACLGSMINARSALRDWSLAAASRQGLPLVEGRTVAVAGTIHPVDQPLIAPFSGRECVICEYDIGRSAAGSSDDEGNTGADFAGFQMTRSIIRSSAGDIRLLGFPILEGVTESVCRGFDAAKNGFEFLRSTEFEDRTGLRMVTILSVFGDVWSDDDGFVQKNMRLRNIEPEKLFPLEMFERLLQREQATSDVPDDPTALLEHESDDDRENDEQEEEDDDDELEDLEDESGQDSIAIPRMTEKRIEVGERVCVIGTYNETHRGLLPKARGRQPNRLLRGTLEQVEQQSRRSMVSRLTGGLLGLVIVNAIVLGIMQLYLHSPDTISRRQREASEAVQQGDVAKLKTLLRRGFDPNLPDSDGKTLLDLAAEANQESIVELLQKPQE